MAIVSDARSDDIAERILKRVDLVLGKIDEVLELLAPRRKEILTVVELSKLVGRSPYTIRRWIGEGRVNAVRVEGTGPKGRLLIPRSEIDKIISSAKGEFVPDVVSA